MRLADAFANALADSAHENCMGSVRSYERERYLEAADKAREALRKYLVEHLR